MAKASGAINGRPKPLGRRPIFHALTPIPKAELPVPTPTPYGLVVQMNVVLGTRSRPDDGLATPKSVSNHFTFDRGMSFPGFGTN